MANELENITDLLNRAAAGDSDAGQEVLPYVYDLLRRTAAARMANLPPGQTLEPTALVHEAYLRLSSGNDVAWESRSEFLFAAARSMRNILIDGARRKASAKHGGGLQRVELDELVAAIETPGEDMLVLDKALEKLEDEDPEGHRVAMLRYFAGLSVPKTAEALGVSVSTVERKWRFTRAWLNREFETG